MYFIGVERIKLKNKNGNPENYVSHNEFPVCCGRCQRCQSCAAVVIGEQNFQIAARGFPKLKT
jgi:hypothetical protein